MRDQPGPVQSSGLVINPKGPPSQGLPSQSRAALRRIAQWGERRDLWFGDARHAAESQGPNDRPSCGRSQRAALARLLRDPPPAAAGGSTAHVSALAGALALAQQVAMTPRVGRRGLQRQAAFVRGAVCQARLAARAAEAAAAAAAEQRRVVEAQEQAFVDGSAAQVTSLRQLAALVISESRRQRRAVDLLAARLQDLSRRLAEVEGIQCRGGGSGSRRGDTTASDSAGSSADEEAAFWADGVGGCVSQWGAAPTERGRSWPD